MTYRTDKCLIIGTKNTPIDCVTTYDMVLDKEVVVCFCDDNKDMAQLIARLLNDEIVKQMAKATK